MTVDDIIAASQACIGTPFRHQGRQIGVALDCAGYAAHIAHAVGCKVIDQTGYGRYPAHGILRGMVEAQPFLVQIPTEEARTGDFLLMRFGGPEQHLAVISRPNYIMHAYEPSGAVVEHIMSSKWKQRVVSAYRFRDLTNV